MKYLGNSWFKDALWSQKYYFFQIKGGTLWSYKFFMLRSYLLSEKHPLCWKIQFYLIWATLSQEMIVQVSIFSIQLRFHISNITLIPLVFTADWAHSLHWLKDLIQMSQFLCTLHQFYPYCFLMPQNLRWFFSMYLNHSQDQENGNGNKVWFH